MSATLKIGPSPVGLGFRRFVVECRHHETRGDVIVPDGCEVTDAQLARVVTASFANASRCGCGRELAARYARVELPPSLLVTPGAGPSRN